MVTREVSSVDGLVTETDALGSGDVVIVEPGDYVLGSPYEITSAGVEVRARNDAVLGSGPVTHLQFESPGDDAVKIRVPDVTFRGFEVSGGDNKGIELDGNPENVIVERCDVHDFYLWGIMMNTGTGHVIRDCYSHHNFGDPGNSDGFNGTGSQNCEFVRCQAWQNGDDGFDMWNGDSHYIRDCWAWDSGIDGGDGNGFKLGGSPNNPDSGNHRVERCVSFDNPETGFDFNGSEDPIEVVNCTAFNNGLNFHFGWASHYLANNISAGGGGERVDEQVMHEGNTWNLGISDPMFVSTDPADDDAFHLRSESPCINAGVDVGLEHIGEAPDLGAFAFDPGNGDGNGDGNGNGNGENGNGNGSDPPRRGGMISLVGIGLGVATIIEHYRDQGDD